MIKRVSFAMLFVLMGWVLCFPAFSEVEMTIHGVLRMQHSPLDTVLSANGNWLYILTDTGTVSILSSDMKEVGRLDVGHHVDKIIAGPREDIIFLKSREEKSWLWPFSISSSRLTFQMPPSRDLTMRRS